MAYENVSATDIAQLRQVAADLRAAKGDLAGLTDPLPASQVECHAAATSDEAYTKFHGTVITAVNTIGPVFDNEAAVIESWCARVEEVQRKAKAAIEKIAPKTEKPAKPTKPTDPGTQAGGINPDGTWNL